MLVELEALNTDDPPCLERVVALGRPLEHLQGTSKYKAVCMKLGVSRELLGQGRA